MLVQCHAITVMALVFRSLLCLCSLVSSCALAKVINVHVITEANASVVARGEWMVELYVCIQFNSFKLSYSVGVYCRFLLLLIPITVEENRAGSS